MDRSQQPISLAADGSGAARRNRLSMDLREFFTHHESWLKAARLVSDLTRYNPLYYGSVRRTIAELDRAEFGERQAFSDAHCLRVLRHARQTTYGRSRPLAWREWPILAKQAIRDRPADFLRRTLIGVPAATGGTTGVPLRLLRSLRGVAAEQAFIDSLLGPGKSFRTARLAVLRAFALKDRTDDNPPYGGLTQGGRCLMLSSYHLSRKTAWWYRDELKRFRPDILFAYPSMLARLLNTIGAGAPGLNVPVVLCSSETMPDGLREEAETRLAGKLVDFYGLAERVCFASSMRKGEFYFSPAYGRTELLPSAADPGVTGCVAARIVATGFWNNSMPLVRYDTGDLALLPAGLSGREIHEIELGLRPFPGILGRQGETILLPDGTVVYGLNQIPKGIDHASQIQIAQIDPLRIALFVVPKPGYASQDSEALMRNARARFPPEVEIRIEIVDRLRQTAAGKTPFVLRLGDEGSRN
jgi:phenylacetate-CoA ligase